ncbi:MAG TPA: DUF6249 domain-containing protein [Ignavibacteria bacterium]
MNDFIEGLIPLTAIIFTFGIPGAIIFWYIYIRHKERTKLMDMGLTPQEARDYFKEQERRPKNPYSSLKWGILLTMIGLGLFIGIILDEMGFKDSLTGVMVLLFGGLGFLIYYFVIRKKGGNGSTATTTQTSN